MPTAFIRKQDGGVLKMDAVTEISESFTSRTTDNPISNGDVVTDHYINEPSTFSVSGVITDDFTAAPTTTGESGSFEGALNNVKEYRSEVQSLRESKETFSYINPDGIVFNTCLLTSVQFNKDTLAYNGWSVTMEIKALILADEAATTAQPVPAEEGGVGSDAEGKSESATDNTEEETTAGGFCKLVGQGEECIAAFEELNREEFNLELALRGQERLNTLIDQGQQDSEAFEEIQELIARNR